MKLLLKRIDNALIPLDDEGAEVFGKLKSGHFDTVVSHKGEAVYIPKSINFASMGEDKFKEFFSKAIDICLEFTPEQDMNSILIYC
jgi:hypothetical protein